MKKIIISSISAALLAGLVAMPLSLPVYAQEAAGQLENLPEAQEFITIDGTAYTLEQLKTLYSMRPVPDVGMHPDELAQADQDILGKVGRTIGAYDYIAADARESGIELTDEQRLQVDQTVAQAQNQLLYKELILDRMTEPSEEDLRKAYEEKKDELYRQEEELRLRQIFISRYVPHIVEAGETLEQIAREVAGDEAVVDTILSDRTKRPRVEGLEEAENPAPIAGEPVEPQDTGETLPPRALIEGEVLLVPVVGESAEAIAERAKEAYQKLEEGESFLDVAQEYSDNERPGEQWVIRPERQDRPIMAEIRETFMSLEDEEYSEPIHTKHGYHIIYRDTYRPSGYRSFEEVRATIEQNWTAEKQQALVEDFFRSQMEDEMVTIHMEAFAKEEEEREPTDVLVTLGDKEITRGEVISGTRLPFPLQADKEQAKQFLQSAVPVQMVLLEAYKKKSGYDELPQFSFTRKAAENTFLARIYLTQAAEEADVAVEDAEVESFYEKQKETAFKVPESYELVLLVKSFQPGEDDDAAMAEARKELKAELEGVASEEDFKAVAARVGTITDPRMQRINRRNMLASQLEPADLEAVRSAEVPGMTDIIERNNELVVYWVASEQEEGYRSLEEVQEQIRQNLEAQKKNEFVEKTLDSYRQRVDVQVLAEKETEKEVQEEAEEETM